MRYGAETKLRVGQVFDLARAHFGPQGRAGLAITEESPDRLVFAGGGGYVILGARRGGDRTRVELEVQEWDNEAQQFLADLPGARGPLAQFLGRWLGRPRRGER
jgi:hypothetical protein